MANLTYLNEGDKTEVQGSGKKPYLLRRIGGVVDCSCPAWRNLGGPIDVRVCKHIKANIDPACLLPQAQAVFNGGVVLPKAGLAMPMAVAIKQAQAGTGPAVTVGTTVVGPRLTKTGKISTAVGGAVVKDTAPPCLLAHKWEDEDPTGWWMSEKLDGVRAWWNGTDFISRLGNTYHAPDWFKAEMPPVVLDGELFVGRKRFQETISAVRKLVPTDSEWQNVKFMIFDGGWFPGEDGTAAGDFETRQQWLKEEITDHLGNCGGLAEVVEQIRCEGTDHLKKHLLALEKKGAEGVMLRKPGSLYEAGRSNTCLKVKTFFDDEAVILGYTEGKGKHKGRVGALVCSWGDVQFEVGTGLKDEERKSPPAIGTKITFRYQELTEAGIPRFPSFVSARDYE